ncbi:MAG: prepilin-type N-terminal cleavage/methylation domain-containing protein [Thermodesulfobacteriota bacterium]
MIQDGDTLTIIGAGRERGFTLFEVLAVMIIVALLAGVSAPALGRIMDNLEFRQQVGKFTAVFRYARLLAISKGEIVSLKLSEEEDCLFVISGPVDETRECHLGEDDVLEMDPGEVFFYPEGLATPVLLTFEKGERVRRISLDILTGRPVVE